MSTLVIPINEMDSDLLAQLDYALAFASKDIRAYRINAPTSTIEADVDARADLDEVSRNILELVERYRKRDFGMPTTIHFEQKRALTPFNAWRELVDRRWVTPIGAGQVVLRGLAARLMDLIDVKVLRTFAREFNAEFEVYPTTIQCTTLDRCHHFTSFPEHMDFVGHLKEDLNVLNQFSGACRETGWSPQLHEGQMAAVDLAISPSCCYHCYEAMEDWDIQPPGRCITAVLGCHRYEGSNHTSMSRLRSFTMREVVFVGTPQFVIGARARAEELIVNWAKDWDLSCTFETANDMFFTKDYSVKASFQRQQQAKKELRLEIPQEQQFISVFSSNFHATSFGKAFNISTGGRPATSGCIAWGYERWVYAIFSQFGCDVAAWPPALRRELEAGERR